MIRSLSPRESAILSVTLVLVLFFAVYKLVYVRVEDDKARIAARIAKTQKELQKNRMLLKEAAGVERQNAKLIASVQREGTDEHIMSSMLAEIQTVAMERNVTFSEIKPQRVRQSDMATHFSVSLILESDVTALFHLIHALQSPPHIFKIEELRIDKKSTSTAAVKCSLVVTRVRTRR